MSTAENNPEVADKNRQVKKMLNFPTTTIHRRLPACENFAIQMQAGLRPRQQGGDHTLLKPLPDRGREQPPQQLRKCLSMCVSSSQGYNKSTEIFVHYNIHRGNQLA